MAQVMVNFRIDEETKRSMEQACREMGLSMTTAFTIFAKKVGKEKRIPFEVTAEPYRTGPCGQRPRGDSGQAVPSAPSRRQERLERLCAEIRRTLTSIHTAIPASITGLPMERIRLLCGDELKDKAAGVSSAVGALFSGRDAGRLEGRDLGILDEYADGLSSVAEELSDIGRTLIPAMKACPAGDFAPYAGRLSAASQKFDALAPVMQRFLSSSACDGGARAVEARLRKAAAAVETAYVLTAVEALEALALREFDALEGRTRARLESDYLPALELTLRELAQAERDAGDVGAKAALCLRAVNVLTQVISNGRQARREWDGRNLEAEVEALERLAAMRGDLSGGMEPGD